MTKEEIKYQWLSLPEWQRLVVVGIFVAAIIYFFYFLVIIPKKDKVKSLNEDVTELQEKVDRLRAIAKPEKLRELNRKYLSIKKDIENLKIQIAKLEKKIPSQLNIEELIMILSNTMYMNNLRIENIGVKKEKTIYVYKEGDRLIFSEKKKEQKVNKVVTGQKKKTVKKHKKEEIKLKEVTILLNAEGSIPNLKRALDSISKSRRFLSIDKLKLYKDKSGILKYTLNLKTYYIPGGLK